LAAGAAHGVWCDQKNGRSRRAVTGRDHHRPLNRHAAARRCCSAVTTMTGRGHRASMAAMTATASSSLGVGVISAFIVTSIQSECVA